MTSEGAEIALLVRDPCWRVHVARRMGHARRVRRARHSVRTSRAEYLRKKGRTLPRDQSLVFARSGHPLGRAPFLRSLTRPRSRLGSFVGDQRREARRTAPRLGSDRPAGEQIAAHLLPQECGSGEDHSAVGEAGELQVARSPRAGGLSQTWPAPETIGAPCRGVCSVRRGENPGHLCDCTLACP